MMKPVCKISINGEPAGGVFNSRLISVEVDDREGATSDKATIVLANDPAAAIPQNNAPVKIWLGYSRPTFMGTFQVDEVSLGHFPHTMTITCKAADFRGGTKSHGERHWDNVTVEQIVRDVAGEMGLSALVDDGVGAHLYKYFPRKDETSFQLLQRLAGNHGAMFSVKDDKVVFAERGAGRTPLGTALGGLTITPDILLPNTLKVDILYGQQVKQVRAEYYDRKQAKRGEVLAESIADAQSTFKLGTPLADMAEAKRAATSKAKELRQNTFKFTCKIVGSPSARAGAPVSFSGMKTGFDGKAFIASSAQHSWSKSNYTVSLSGKSAA